MIRDFVPRLLKEVLPLPTFRTNQVSRSLRHKGGTYEVAAVSIDGMALSPGIMRLILTFLMVCSTAVAMAQESVPPKVSIRPLTADQMAIYKAFLADWHTDPKTPLNVANTTDSFRPERDDLQGCMRSFPKGSRAMEVHLFPEQFATDRIHLLDPAKYKVPEVGDFMHRGEDLDNAVQTAFEAGLMSLSEIIFDQTHHFAALNFSFQCGRLCGHGGTVIYERWNGHWRRSKRSCGSWLS
jgi:hypothetical protein